MADVSNSPAAGAALDLEAENALLRASLADLQSRYAELERRVESDPLTGLPDRRRFLAEVERAVGKAQRHGTPSAVLFIDVNGLGRINQARGFLAGDAALVHVARQLSGLIRATDAVARIGGDSFGLILDHLDPNSAIETSERLARCIAGAPADLGGGKASVTVSIGVTSILPGDNVEEVMRRGARNVSRAKEEG